MYDYDRLVSKFDTLVPRVLADQLWDGDHPEHGAFRDSKTGVLGFCPSQMGVVAYAYLLDGNRFAGDKSLLERVTTHCAYGFTRLSPEGLYSLATCNWHSPPDTSFALQALFPATIAARRKALAGDEDAAVLEDTLIKLTRKMAEGVVGRGFHTPNHRWVVSSTLAMAMHVLPGFDAREYIDSLVAEGIDINDDGDYTERSPGVYSGVCNRSLIWMADYLKRPEFLEPVRKNLDLNAHLLRDDGSIIATFSSRQDKGQRWVPYLLGECFREMGVRDQNGIWLSIADRIAQRALEANQTVHRDSLAVLLRPYLEHPEYAKDESPRQPVPFEYTRLYPVSNYWRVKKGILSATAGAGSSNLFSLEYGPVSLNALRVGASYFHVTEFVADSMEPLGSGNGVRLVDRGGTRTKPGYMLPTGKPLPVEDIDKKFFDRETWDLPDLTKILEIVEVSGGFDLRLHNQGGVDRLTVQIECCFQGPGVWETRETALGAVNGQTCLLKSGHGAFHHDGHGISIGPGGDAHRMWEMRGTTVDNESFRVIIALEAPVDHTLKVRCGLWSGSTHEVVGQ